MKNYCHYELRENCYYNMKIINNEKEKLRLFNWYSWHCGLPWWLRQAVGKKSACNAGDLGSIPGLGRSPGEGNSNPLLYSCLENPMDRGAWRAAVHGVTKSRTRLSDFHSQFHLTLQGFGEGGIYQRGALHPEMSPLPSAWDQSWKIKRRGSVSLHL